MIKNGYTLIEMLVVVFVLGVIMAGAVATYSTMNAKAQVQQTANTIAAQLSAFQKDADAGVDADKCDSQSGYDGIIVSFNTTTGEIQKEIQCTNPPVIDYQPIDLKISKGVNVTWNDGGTPLHFKPLAQGVENIPTITCTGAGVIYQVLLTAAGGIGVKQQ